MEPSAAPMTPAREVGEHDVKVNFNNKPAGNSPYKVNLHLEPVCQSLITSEYMVQG